MHAHHKIQHPSAVLKFPGDSIQTPKLSWNHPGLPHFRLPENPLGELLLQSSNLRAAGFRFPKQRGPQPSASLQIIPLRISSTRRLSAGRPSAVLS